MPSALWVVGLSDDSTKASKWLLGEPDKAIAL